MTTTVLVNWRYNILISEYANGRAEPGSTGLMLDLSDPATG